MRFLVLGCNGMAGHMISLYLKERGYEVQGFGRRSSGLVPCAVGDAMDTDFIRELVGINRYDAIINCIGLLNQSAENNKAEAAYLNSYFPHFLAYLTENTKTKVIHMSTDCVFSGQRGQYMEDDIKDGRAFYDRSKALGELEDDKNITLRNSVVGPDINEKGIGLLNWFMQQRGEIYGYTSAIWTGQTTLQLAKTMETAVLEKAHGLFHAVPDQVISKYELLKLFNHYMRNDKITIKPMNTYIADKSLRRTRYEFNYIIPDYEQMIAELAKWMEEHKSLYPHYNWGRGK